MFNFQDNPDEYKRLMQLEVLIAVVAIAASIVMFNFGVMTGALFAAIAGAFFLMDAIVEGLRDSCFGWLSDHDVQSIPGASGLIKVTWLPRCQLAGPVTPKP